MMNGKPISLTYEDDDSDTPLFEQPPALEQQLTRVEMGISLTEWQQMPGDPAWRAARRMPLSKACAIVIQRFKRRMEYLSVKR